MKILTDTPINRRNFLGVMGTGAAALAMSAAGIGKTTGAAETAAVGATGKLAGSQTAVNLMTAFAGESQACNRYTFFADKACRDGFNYIAEIFIQTASHEQQHARRLFSFMSGGKQEISAGFPFGEIGATVDNLGAGADGERYEYQEMYPNFAKTARDEGFSEISDTMLLIAEAEKMHEKRYLDLQKMIRENTLFSQPQPALWYCETCGYAHRANSAAKSCPICGAPQAFFRRIDE